MKHRGEEDFLPQICADGRRSNREEVGFSFVLICAHLRKSAAKIRAFARCGREDAGAKARNSIVLGGTAKAVP